MSTKINLAELKRELPYKWRVQSFSQYKPEATCVAYVDSRDVQKLLDDVVGPENWQDEYYAVKNNLFCKIGIRVNGEWTWKGDCGTESNVDKEKGEASDAFKRAAVKWGPGRFLYDLGMFKLKANATLVKGQASPYAVDDNGQRIWDITKHINNLIKAQKATKQQQPAKTEPVPAGNLATAEQKAELIQLLNNVVITRDEKTKMAAKLNILTPEQAAKSIDNLKHVIADREAGQTQNPRII